MTGQPLSRYIDIYSEALSIVEQAQSKGIIIRLFGGIASYIHSLHCDRAMQLYKEQRLNGSKGHNDIDVIGYSKQRKQIVEFFEKELGYIPNKYINALFAQKRLIYMHPSRSFYVDIVFDKLEYSHDVIFGSSPGSGRLELDFPTIDLASLVLTKLQIHDINKKDLIDLLMLFEAHPVCEKGVHRECMDFDYILSILTDDWGFWYDAKNNLTSALSIIQGHLRENGSSEAIARISKLLYEVESRPKTKKWEKRAKQGTAKPWYREVEEIER